MVRRRGSKAAPSQKTYFQPLMRFFSSAGFVALQIFRHQDHALMAPFIGILHDRSLDRAFAHAAEGDRILVKANDFYLAELTRFLQHFVDTRRVVGIDADKA